jgi:transcriptional regulator with XRE-family HTH domain
MITNLTWESPQERPLDIDVVAETALAIAQSTICNAMQEREINNAELARRMGTSRSFVSRILSGSHNLTIKTLAKALAVCGFEVAFERKPLQWGWAGEIPAQLEVSVSDEQASAGGAGAYDLAA